MLERVGLPEAARFPTSERKAATDELKKNKTFVQPQKTGDRNLKTAETAPRKFTLHHAVLGLLILLLTGGAAWFYFGGGNPFSSNFFAKKPALSLQAMKINRLSDTSQATDVAISPDGEFVAFIKEDGGRQSLWLRQISAPSSVQIAAPTEGLQYAAPVFSPDGSHIFYLKVKPGEARATLYQLPKLGGAEKKLVGDISFQDSGSNFSISPDGRQVAFNRLDEGFNRSLVTTDLEGADCLFDRNFRRKSRNGV
jgi:Tol biopolymer transport system component